MPSLSLQEFLRPQTNESPNSQAYRLFAVLDQQLKINPEKKIGLIYSANNNQAETLYKAYQADPEGDIPGISGGGQAKLFEALIPLINRSSLKSRIRVIPVATSLSGGANGPGNFVSTEMIHRDLTSIQTHLENGFDVYGIPGPQNRYAIGGNISAYWFETTYTSVQHRGVKKSQGDFVEEMLRELEKDISFNLDEEFGVKSKAKKEKHAAVKAVAKAKNDVKPTSVEKPVVDEESRTAKPATKPKRKTKSADSVEKTTTKAPRVKRAPKASKAKPEVTPDFLPTLNKFRKQGDYKSWSQTKDNLYQQAIDYDSIDEIPKSISDPLRMHYNSVFSIHRFFNIIFEHGETKHWRQVEEFFAAKQARNSLDR